ncbi:cold-shock protein [Nocardioides pacificus]
MASREMAARGDSARGDSARGDSARGDSARGTVREWHAEDGWGVIDSDDTPGGCWAHFSMVLMAGYRTLQAGQEVRFTFEAPGQDGYAFSAEEVRPVGQAPVREVVHHVTGPSAGFRSELVVTFDDEDEHTSET